MEYKTLNLKEYDPTVNLALVVLEIEIELCRREGIKVVKVIHGYGSSGKGGEIKRNLKRWLPIKVRRGFIRDFIAGEQWNSSDKATKFKALCPEVLGDIELYSCNPGVTLILI